jgi:hypothetical protein
MDSADRNEDSAHRLDIVQLLDERYRLREDPERRPDLDLTHARLRQRLSQTNADGTSEPTTRVPRG